VTIFAETLQSGLAALKLKLDAAALAALEQHWRLVAENNQKFNLTAIRDEAEAAHKHYLDCLLLLPLLRAAAAEQQRAAMQEQQQEAMRDQLQAAIQAAMQEQIQAATRMQLQTTVQTKHQRAFRKQLRYLEREQEREHQRAAMLEQQPAPALRAVDIGSGAGFPGLVLALACPESNWTLLEANNKKCSFLRLCIEELSIKNARALPLRAEEAGHKKSLRKEFDLATARAVAALPVLLEYALPLLALGGVFVAAKGPALKEEEAAAANALAVLGAKADKKKHFTLPGGEKRVIACYHKVADTPDKYPRRAGMPEKRPL
jgi:16S rRNA (guanine527-N7)-methyltransferase